MRKMKTYQSPILPEEVAIFEYVVEGKRGSLFQQYGKPRVVALRICGRQLDSEDAQEVVVSDLHQLLELVFDLLEFLLSYWLD